MEQFQRELKRDKEKCLKDSKYQEQIAQEKKELEKKLNEMKQAHEESKNAYRKFIVEKFIQKIEHASSGYYLFIKRHFFVLLLTLLHQHKIRLAKVTNSPIFI